MHPVKDGRSLIKLMDWRYHKQFPISKEVWTKVQYGSCGGFIQSKRKRYELAGKKIPCCQYFFSGERVTVLPIGNPKTNIYIQEVNSVLDVFENTEHITDEEWKFFSTIMPEVIDKLRQIEKGMERIEIFLRDRENSRVLP